MTNGIIPNLVISCGLRALQYNMGPGEDVRNSGVGNSDTVDYVDWISVCASVC